MAMTAGICAWLSRVTNNGSEAIKASGNWISIIQKMIAKGVSVRVSFFVATSVTAKPNAAVNTSSAPRTGAAINNAHAGVVNSSANVIAIGMSRRLIAHRYDDPT